MEENRRVRMTKKLLKDALVELMQDKSVDAVTVKEICQRADVNRSTFYSYYGNPYKLLEEIENDTIAQIMATLSSVTISNVRENLTVLLEYVRQNDRMLRALLSGAQREAFKTRVYRIVCGYYARETEGEWSRIPDRDKAESALLFVTAGALEVLSAWMDSGYRQSPAQLAEWILLLCPSVEAIIQSAQGDAARGEGGDAHTL